MSNTKGEPQSSKKPYKLGVAFSGGGARGFAHAGALLAIEEAGLKPDIVAGVSAGAVIAVLHAAGMKPIEIADVFSKRSVRDFMEINLGRGGLFKIDGFEKFVTECAGKKNLEDLNIPVYLGVTDLDNGRAVYFNSGKIGPRVVASCSIPIVFKPVKIDGVNYVDGGVLRNHPAWIIRDKCETLIGINVSPLERGGQYRGLVDVALRTYNLMAKANQTPDMELCDISIETPEIARYAVFSLNHIKTIFVNGYKQTREALKKAGLWQTAHKQEHSK